MSKSFYIDIPSIFDERAGVVKRIAPEAYLEMFKNGYHKRKGDFFKGVDPEAYKELYHKHEMETLEGCFITNVFQFLQPQIADYMGEYMAKQLPSHEAPKLHINIHGYDFSPEEIANLKSLVYLKIGGIIGVETIDQSMEELEPSRCRDEYWIMIMYDYDKYLNANLAKLRASPCKMLILIAPMVYFNTDPDTDEEARRQIEDGMNGLITLESFASELICLKFVNIDVFSTLYPDDRIQEMDNVKTDNPRDLEEFYYDLKEREAAAMKPN